MKEYLVVYVDHEEITDENGFITNEIPRIRNTIENAKNKREVYNDFEYTIINIICLEEEE